MFPNISATAITINNSYDFCVSFSTHVVDRFITQRHHLGINALYI